MRIIIIKRQVAQIELSCYLFKSFIRLLVFYLNVSMKHIIISTFHIILLSTKATWRTLSEATFQLTNLHECIRSIYNIHWWKKLGEFSIFFLYEIWPCVVCVTHVSYNIFSVLKRRGSKSLEETGFLNNSNQIPNFGEFSSP